MKEKILIFLKNCLFFILAHKIPTAIIASATALAITATCITVSINNNKAVTDKPESKPVSEIEKVEEEEEEVPESAPESVPEESVPVQAAPAPTTPRPSTTVTDIRPTNDTSYMQSDIYTTHDNNVFMDALGYTGYNLAKHRADGNMWKYVPSKSKAGLGYLSKISYGAGCTGYETDANGKPNLARFQQGDLVCASFVTYVYFNYLPNVAGIDTSSLTRPTNSMLADSWYTAAKDWVAKGYSQYIPFDYSIQGATGNSFITFSPSREIPIGSIIVLFNPRTSRTSGSHVAVYAGRLGGYDWLYHVGNDNGPEFCAIQRMNFGPNPRWPLAVITPPSNIRFSPVLQIELKDDNGKPIAGSEFIIKHPTSGKQENLGVTDQNGKITKSGLSYGDFELIQTLTDGYTCKSQSHTIKLTAANNSLNIVSIVNEKVKDKETKTEEEEENKTEDPAIPPETDKKQEDEDIEE